MARRYILGLGGLILSAGLLLILHIAASAEDQRGIRFVAQVDEIDEDELRQLRRRFLRGEQLSDAELRHLQRARQARRQLPPVPRRAPLEPKPSTGLIPLSDMTAEQTYRGDDGGLYGGGRNSPPQDHFEAAKQASRTIQPLDHQGNPSPDGKIVLLSCGMSNTTQEFQAFIRLVQSDMDVSPAVVLVDGAQGGMDAHDWAHPARRFREDRDDPWRVLDRRLYRAGVRPSQVQVVWIKQARRDPAALGAFPRHVQQLQDNLAIILVQLRQRFPNLQLAYLSSRIYAGYATTALNPEPYAYESAFAVRWLIQDQIDGELRLNYDPHAGPVNAPVALWGPYLWADGMEGRNSDDLVWHGDDLARDGTHPSASGQKKVAELLLDFFKTEPTAQPWFVRQE